MLAAGHGRRASNDGGVNKLLARNRDGRRMIDCSVRAVLDSRADTVVVVLGHQAAAVGSALDEARLQAGDRLRIVLCEDHAEGMAASLRSGIATIRETSAAAVAVCLGDMPLLRPQTLDRMITALADAPAAVALAPRHEGRRGNPVLWRRVLFASLLGLTGDQGARSLLRKHAARLIELDVDDAGVLEDFDTAGRLELFASLV